MDLGAVIGAKISAIFRSVFACRQPIRRGKHYNSRYRDTRPSFRHRKRENRELETEPVETTREGKSRSRLNRQTSRNNCHCGFAPVIEVVLISNCTLFRGQTDRPNPFSRVAIYPSRRPLSFLASPRVLNKATPERLTGMAHKFSANSYTPALLSLP